MEAQFYLLLPPLVAAVTGLTRALPPPAQAAAVAGTFVALGIGGRAAESVLAPLLYGQGSQVTFRSVVSYLDLFGYGMAVAAIHRAGGGPGGVKTAALLSAGGVLFLAANNLAHAAGGEWYCTSDSGYAFAFPPLIGSAMAFFLAASLTPVARRSWFNNAPLRFVGRISYSVYLYHIGVQFVGFRYVHLEPFVENFHLRGLAYGLAFLAPTFVVATVMYVLVEVPCLALAARLRPAAPNVAPAP